MKLAGWFLAAIWLQAALQAAVVQGVVLDRENGAPLARTIVSLIPVEGTRAQTVTLRTAERGTFAIMNVAPGWYILRGARKVYVTGEVGQSRPGRPGRPFEVERDDQSFFLELRMTRLGAVSGVVVDENNIGIPEWDVHVYSTKPRVTRVAQAKTDDRGVFRVFGLEPGEYVARSGEGELDDGTMLVPTYHKFGTDIENASPVPTNYGETTPDLRMQPMKGKLFSIEGTVGGDCDRLTMVTDTGRRIVNSGRFRIERVPPGKVDLIAEGPQMGGLLHLTADRDMVGKIVPCGYLGPYAVSWGGDVFSRMRTPVASSRNAGTLTLRRVDLDGVGEPRVVKNGDTVTPGFYEATAVSADQTQYATGIYEEGRQGAARPDGSYLIEVVSRPMGAAIAIRAGAPKISGTVTSDGKPVIGAPVYIELIDTNRVGDVRLRIWSLRTDVSGRFLLAGLTPGRYRILSSFDLDPQDRYAMERAKGIDLREGESSIQELKMLP